LEKQFLKRNNPNNEKLNNLTTNDFQTNIWRKVRAQRGCVIPRGRRGHTALVHRGQMLIYGGYQDLRGSSSELWAFHFGMTSRCISYIARSIIMHSDSELV